MKPFQFNLEKVLKMRQLQTLKAKQALAAAQLAVGQAWVSMERARNDRTASATAMEQMQTQRVRVGTLTVSSERHDALSKAELLAAERLQAATAEVDVRRAELTEAKRREKALEKLREQQYEVSRHEVERAEQAENDEMAQLVGHNPRRDARL
jgi:flagellar FliJ protein